MSIPMATTTISILEPDPTADSYEERENFVTASGVRASLSSPSGYDRILGGEESVVSMRLDCDICPIAYSSTVVDEVTHDQWRVVWVRERFGLGLDHVEAGLSRVEGSVPL